MIALKIALLLVLKITIGKTAVIKKSIEVDDPLELEAIKMEENEAENTELVDSADDKAKEVERDMDETWNRHGEDVDAAESDISSKEEFDSEEFDSEEFDSEEEKEEEKYEQNPDLIEGDIVPFPRSRLMNPGSTSVRSANAINAMAGNISIWDNVGSISRKVMVPYYFDNSQPRGARKKIKSALSVLKKKVNARGRCLTFRPVRRSDRNYIRIINTPGCYSYVGRKGGQQDISLGPRCLRTGTIQHEFLHALGFWHEQSRIDRDSYISILWNNIIPKYKGEFEKKIFSNNQGFRYDTGSVMHYGTHLFSKNGRPTIQAKNGRKIGQREGVSDQDVLEIRKLYGCR